ncbi:MAG: twin-arginine translocase subunit TatC [Firmicutes bacterium]|nr:twin-arginine translocase subunit TatC [Bacillota bacterium]
MRLEGVVRHLAELRRRIIYVLIAFVVSLAGCIAIVGRIYHFLLLPGVRLAILGPGDVVRIYFLLGSVAALVPVTPFAAWQLWLFVAPGLRERERQYAARLIAPVALMFLAGVSFGYFLVFPRIYRFLIFLGQQNFRMFITANEYFGFMVNIVVPFGLVFELPVAVVFLTRLGLINPRMLRRVRKYAYLVCVILGTLISPPELVSHLSVTVPMILIYELSIVLSSLADKRRIARMAPPVVVVETPDLPPGQGGDDDGGDDDGGDGANDDGGGGADAGGDGGLTALSPGAQGSTSERAAASHPVSPGALPAPAEPRDADAVPARLREHVESAPASPRRPGIHVEQRE